MNQEGLTPILVLLIILLIGGGIAGGYYLGKTNYRKSLPTNSIQPNPTPVKTADWKTYTNRKYKYSIGYPDELIYREDGIDIVRLFFKQDEIKEDKLYKFYNRFIIIAQEGKISPSEAAAKQASKELQKDVSVNNSSGVRFSASNYYLRSNKNEGPTVSLTLFAPAGTFKDKGEFDRMSDLFEKIVSTFKFTDQKNTPEEIAENFYKWYINCLDKTVGRGNLNQCNYTESIYVGRELAKNKKIDLICAQNVPVYGSVDRASITGANAKTTVHTLFSESGDNPITVYLELINSEWKIVNIICNKGL